MSIYSRTKTGTDKFNELIFRILFGLCATTFTILLTIGSFARGQLSSKFSGQFMDSGDASVIGFILSSPGYLILPIIVGILAAIYPRKLWELLGRKA